MADWIRWYRDEARRRADAGQVNRRVVEFWEMLYGGQLEIQSQPIHAYQLTDDGPESWADTLAEIRSLPTD